MSLISLNIYNDADEIVKTYSTNRVRWGVITKAVELEELTKGDDNGAESVKAITDLMFLIFPSMTPDDLAAADFNDMQNVFKMVVNMTGHIQKNA